MVLVLQRKRTCDSGDSERVGRAGMAERKSSFMTLIVSLVIGYRWEMTFSPILEVQES